jgi:DNA-binding response OmpR family regulator
MVTVPQSSILDARPQFKQGIELAVKFIPDLIICDVLMPEMDGYEVLHSLLETSATYQIPFIFSTSMSERVERIEALTLGADDYIIKPFDMEVLLKMIKTWIKTGSDRRIITDTKSDENIRVWILHIFFACFSQQILVWYFQPFELSSANRNK